MLRLHEPDQQRLWLTSRPFYCWHSGAISQNVVREGDNPACCPLERLPKKRTFQSAVFPAFFESSGPSFLKKEREREERGHRVLDNLKEGRHQNAVLLCLKETIVRLFERSL